MIENPKKIVAPPPDERMVVPESVAKEEAFLVNSFRNPSIFDAQYAEMVNNLVTTGTDPSYETWLSSQANGIALARQEALQGIIASPDIDMETKLRALEASDNFPPIAVDSIESYEDRTMGEEAIVARDEGSVHQKEVVEDKIDVYSIMDDTARASSAIAESVQRTIADSNAEPVQAFLDMMKLGVPFYNNVLYTQIATRIAPKWAEHLEKADKAGVFKYILPGEMTEVWKDVMRELGPNQKVEFFNDVVAAAEDATADGFFNRNDFAKFAVVMDMADEVRMNPDALDIDRNFDNFFGLFDVVFAKSAITWMKQGGRAVALTAKARGNLRHLTNQIEEDMNRLIAAGIADPVVAKELGATSEEIAILTVMPTVDSAAQTSPKVTAALAEVVARQMATRNITLKIVNQANFLSAADKRLFHEQMFEQVSSFQNHNLYSNLSRIVTRTTDEALDNASTFRAHLVFGFDEKTGFSTVADAQRAAKEFGYENV
ncbi:MAG: hypothetical protein ACXABY_33640, partial [Candidatus Thorarchaeota archaeon]